MTSAPTPKADIATTADKRTRCGAFAPDGKTDWSVGVARDLGRVSLDLSWIDSDADDGQAIASVFVTF